MKPLLLRTKLLIPALLLYLGLMLGYSWMSPEVSAPNERTRLYLALAMVERQELTIDQEIRRHGKVFDLSKKDGHYYTDKAPGSSFLAVPAVWIYKMSRPKKEKLSIEALNDLVRRWVMIPMTLLGLLALFGAMKRLDLPSRLGAQMLAALAIGTPLFHYGAAFYGHALVLSFASLSAYFMLRTKQPNATEKPNKNNTIELTTKDLVSFAAASFSAAMCFFIEYQGAIFCVAFALAFLSRRERLAIKPILAAAAGALLPVGATLLYNKLAFGGFLTTSYQYLAHASSVEAHEKGLFGIMLPTAESLHGLFLSPARSLLFTAPLGLIGFAGLFWLWKRSRTTAIYGGVAMLLVTLVTLGFHVPFWGFGQRLMVPILGFSTLAAASLMFELEQKRPLISFALKGWIAFAMLYNVLVSTAFPEFPAEITNPLQSVALPIIAQDSVSTNLGGLYLQSRAATGLYPLYLMTALAIAYLLAPLKRLEPKRLFAGIAIALTLASLLGVMVWRTPEERHPVKLEKWQNWAMNLRWHPVMK